MLEYVPECVLELCSVLQGHEPAVSGLWKFSGPYPGELADLLQRRWSSGHHDDDHCDNRDGDRDFGLRKADFDLESEFGHDLEGST